MRFQFLISVGDNEGLDTTIHNAGHKSTTSAESLDYEVCAMKKALSSISAENLLQASSSVVVSFPGPLIPITTSLDKKKKCKTF